MTSQQAVLISVVIPAYNASTYIHRAIGSVLDQSLQDYEILVVNDGSPDTSELERALQPYSAQIRYFNRPHGGPSAARNFGIREARGRYVAFLDSDDYWLPQHLATHKAILDHDPELGLVYGNAIVVRDGYCLGNTFDRESQILPVTFESLLQELSTVGTSSTVASRSALIEAGLFDERMYRCEDYDLWLRMAFRGAKMTHFREPTMCRTLSGITLSADGYRMKCARVEVVEKLLSTLPLTAEQRTLAMARQRELEADAHLDRFKICLQNGEFEEARESARIASSKTQSWKFNAAIFCLEKAPRTLQLLYRAHEHMLRFRQRIGLATWKRSTSSAPPGFIQRKPLADIAQSTSASGH